MPPIDLESLDSKAGAEKGFELPLTHPATGEKLGATIRVLGFESELYQQKLAEIRGRALERTRRNRGRKLDPEQLREEVKQESIEQLVEVTAGWDLGPLRLDGKPIEYSRANALKVYQQYNWILEQVDQAVHDRANFFPVSATI